MLADIIELRRADSARPRDEVRASVPARVTMSVDRFWTDAGLDRAPVHAFVTPMCLEPLYDVRLRYWRGLNIVLTGRQRQPVPGRRQAERLFDQVWWCRIVTDPSIPPISPADRRRRREAAGRAQRADPAFMGGLLSWEEEKASRPDHS